MEGLVPITRPRSSHNRIHNKIHTKDSYLEALISINNYNVIMFVSFQYFNFKTSHQSEPVLSTGGDNLSSPFSLVGF